MGLLLDSTQPDSVYDTETSETLQDTDGDASGSQPGDKKKRASRNPDKTASASRAAGTQARGCTLSVAQRPPWNLCRSFSFHSTRLPEGCRKQSAIQRPLWRLLASWIVESATASAGKSPFHDGSNSWSPRLCWWTVSGERVRRLKIARSFLRR